MSRISYMVRENISHFMIYSSSLYRRWYWCRCWWQCCHCCCCCCCLCCCGSYVHRWFNCYCVVVAVAIVVPLPYCCSCFYFVSIRTRWTLSYRHLPLLPWCCCSCCSLLYALAGCFYLCCCCFVAVAIVVFSLLFFLGGGVVFSFFRHLSDLFIFGVLFSLYDFSSILFLIVFALLQDLVCSDHHVSYSCTNNISIVSHITPNNHCHFQSLYLYIF